MGNRLSTFSAWAILALIIVPVAGRCHTVTYGHDASGRLTSVRYGNGFEAVYSYDPEGNRLSMAARNCVAGMPGDVSGDCAVTLEDAVLAARVMAGGPGAAPGAGYLGGTRDADGDLALTPADTLYILEAVAGQRR
jgi:YD repeat-containing protein